MKKILSVILVTILLVSCVPFSAGAFVRPDPPFEWDFLEDENIIKAVRESFKEQIFTRYPSLSSKDEEFPEDQMLVQVICTQDEATVYWGVYGASGCVVTSQVIGQFVFFNGALDGPEFENPVGLYAMKNDGTTVNLIDAYEEGLVDIEDVAAHYPYSTKIPDMEYAVAKKLGLLNKDAFGTYYRYHEIKRSACVDLPDATPDWVVVEAGGGAIYEGAYIEVIGDYVVSSRTNFLGNALPYYVYFPGGELLTLKEAAKIAPLAMFILDTEIPCALLGDADGDQKLTVKDATYIQKKVADFRLDSKYDYSMEEVVLDFDGDKKITVKDATAIQKRIAGLEDKPATPDEGGLTGDLLGASVTLRYLLDTYTPFSVIEPGSTYPYEDINAFNNERKNSEALLERGDFTMEEILSQTDKLIKAIEKFTEVDIFMEVC